jgi:hypothetical protein
VVACGREVGRRVLIRAAGEQVIDGPFRGTVVNCVPSGAGASLRQPQAKNKAVREGPAGLIAVDSAHVLEAMGPAAAGNGASQVRNGSELVGAIQAMSVLANLRLAGTGPQADQADHGPSSASRRGDSGGRGDAARSELPFGWGDQSERAAVLRKGDAVSFAVVVDRPTKTRSGSCLIAARLVSPS